MQIKLTPNFAVHKFHFLMKFVKFKFLNFKFLNFFLKKRNKDAASIGSSSNYLHKFFKKCGKILS